MIAHPNGEEHSRVPKGNGVRKNVNESAEKMGENLVTDAAAAAESLCCVFDNKMIAPLLWQCQQLEAVLLPQHLLHK